MIPPLLVLRHGETEWNAAGRLQGHSDSPLTPLGVAQARQQKAILRGMGVDGWHWLSSPSGRARATADLASEGFGIDIAEDARLMEIGMGRWTGASRAEIQAECPQAFEQDDLSYYDAAPEGEGLTALALRCEDLLRDLNAPTILVTHGITSRTLRCLALGIDPDRLAELPGGQGIVHHVEAKKMRVLTGVGGLPPLATLR